MAAFFISIIDYFVHAQLKAVADPVNFYMYLPKKLRPFFLLLHEIFTYFPKKLLALVLALVFFLIPFISKNISKILSHIFCFWGQVSNSANKSQLKCGKK